MTPNTDVLLSLQRQSQSLIMLGEFGDFVHIMENTHRTQSCCHPLHILLLLLFFTLSVFSFQTPFFFVWFSNLQSFRAMHLVTGLFFPSLSLSSLTCSFPWWLHRNFFKKTLLWPDISSNLTHQVLFSFLSQLQSRSHCQSPYVYSCPLFLPPLLSSPLLNQWWTLGVEGSESHRTQGDHKGPLTFSRWLGLRLICPCHPRWQNTKAQHHEGLHFTPSPQLWPPSIKSLTLCF